jgi:ankyrin repeat protein
MATPQSSDNIFGDLFDVPQTEPQRSDQAQEKERLAARQAELAVRQDALNSQPHQDVLAQTANRALIEASIVDNVEDFEITRQDHFRYEAEVEREHLSIIDTANSTHVDHNGAAPLAQLCFMVLEGGTALRDEAIGRLLLQGADPYAIDLDGRTALHEADASATELLLGAISEDERANYANQQDEQGDTALHVCAEQGDEPRAQALLDAGADPSLRNHQGNTPADRADARGHTNLVAQLDRHELTQAVVERRGSRRRSM